MLRQSQQLYCLKVGEQNNLSGNKHSLLEESARMPRSVYTAQIQLSQQSSERLRRKAVKSKSSIIRLHRGPTNVDFGAAWKAL